MYNLANLGDLPSYFFSEHELTTGYLKALVCADSGGIVVLTYYIGIPKPCSPLEYFKGNTFTCNTLLAGHFAFHYHKRVRYPLHKFSGPMSVEIGLRNSKQAFRKSKGILKVQVVVVVRNYVTTSIYSYLVLR